MEIPIFYDSMLCKLITYGKNRQEAIDRMVRAIKDFTITGVKTTLPFGKFVMENEYFRLGKFDTHFVKNHFDSTFLESTSEDEARIAASLAKYLVQNNSQTGVSKNNNSKITNWKKNRA